MKPVITVLGAGLMGSALVRTYLKQGYETWVWNRTRSRCEPLVAEGARIAATVAEAVAAATVVVVNVNTYDTANQLLRNEQIESLLRGKVVVQLTTGTPKQSRDMAGWAVTREIPYLDGAIMVTPDLVGGPGCTVLYSGPEELFAAQKGVLEALGGKTLHVGVDYGYASTLDSAILTFFWAYNFGVLQAISLCQVEAFPLDMLSQSLAGMQPFVANLGAEMTRRVLTGDFKAELATLEICHNSVKLLIEQSKDGGLDHTMFDAFDSLFQQAVNAGHAGSDLSVISRFIRKPGEAAVA